jgi:hypothetical protein
MSASRATTFTLEPRFKQVTTASQILKDLARLNPDKVPQQAVFQAVQAEAQRPMTGVTFFPPNTCDPTIVAPAAPRTHLMQAAATVPEMPTYFCWADSDIVTRVKGWGKRPASLGPYTSPVANQHTCGSCWAVASAGVFSDRWAIYTQDVNPQLSSTELLSCASVSINPQAYPNCDGCNGGLPAGAAAYFAQAGTVSSTCESYAWCDRDRLCSGQQASVGGGDSSAYLNRIIPRCTSQRCAAPNDKRFKVKYYRDTAPPKLTSLSYQPPTRDGAFTLRALTNSAALSVTGIRDIQLEILANGPVVGAMAIFYDFQAGTMPGAGAWAPTKNVYCNVQGIYGFYPYNKTRYAHTEAQLMGWHAVAVVGWGLEKDVDDWTMPGRKFDLPYWIVRNSWGAEWNAGCTVNGGKVKLPGHFKIAWTDASKNINTKVYLDNAQQGQLGGTTAFEPAILRAAPPAGGGGGGAGGDKKRNGELKKYVFNATSKQCVEVASDVGAGGGKVYDTAEACVADNRDAFPVTYDCNYVKGVCAAVTDGSGKYGSESECEDACGGQHSTFLALVITGSIVVAAAIAVGVGVGVSRAKAKRLVV